MDNANVSTTPRCQLCDGSVMLAGEHGLCITCWRSVSDVPALVKTLLILRKRIWELEAEIARVAPYLAAHGVLGYSLEKVGNGSG